jgi:hypothetical protein
MKEKPNMLVARASCMPVFICIGFLGMLMLLCDVVTVQVNTRFIGRGHGRSSGVLSFLCMLQGICFLSQCHELSHEITHAS